MKKDQRVRNIMANPAENNVKNESPMQENKMGVMPVGKLLFSMSLPIMISMLVQALYNVVDSMFVARVSENALTALSMAFPIQNLMIAVSTGLGVGAGQDGRYGQPGAGGDVPAGPSRRTPRAGREGRERRELRGDQRHHAAVHLRPDLHARRRDDCAPVF